MGYSYIHSTALGWVYPGEMRDFFYDTILTPCLSFDPRQTEARLLPRKGWLVP